jgi:hypothetical protein
VIADLNELHKDKPLSKKEFAEYAKASYPHPIIFSLNGKIFEKKDPRLSLIGILKSNTTAKNFESVRELFGIQHINFFNNVNY